MNNRKPRRSRSAMPDPAYPTERQIDAAMAAFDKSKLRHQIVAIGERTAVRILPDLLMPDHEFLAQPIRAKVPAEMKAMISESFSVKYFPDEPSARQWREREIIKEAIIAGLRAKP